MCVAWASLSVSNHFLGAPRFEKSLGSKKAKWVRIAAAGGRERRITRLEDTAFACNRHRWRVFVVCKVVGSGNLLRAAVVLLI